MRNRLRTKTAAKSVERSFFNGANIILRRRRWYLVSAIILAVSLLALAVFRLQLGIDFTGGSVLEVESRLSDGEIREIAGQYQIKNLTINTGEAGRKLIRYPETARQEEFQTELKDGGTTIMRLDQIGPSVSRDLIKNAVLSLVAMSTSIVAYVTYVFRRVPKSISALSFGVVTITAAFLHDALFVLGIFAVLGRVLGVEVDSFIITAILTVIGFSIHDTIVVFDRIREKLAKTTLEFTQVVGDSIQETLVRSLNTSLVIILVLLALFLFGGASTRYFVLALLVGMVSGTYSSVFIASPLLVSWHLRREARRKPKQ